MIAETVIVIDSWFGIVCFILFWVFLILVALIGPPIWPHE